METRSAQTKVGMAAKRARGESLGTPPYGWAKELGTGKLVPNPWEQKVLRTVRLLANDGASSRQIAAALNKWTRNRKGGPFRHTQIVRMLRT